MVLTKSNKLGEDVYRKEVFYIDTKGLTDSLYSEMPEFRSFLSRELSNKIVDSLESILEGEPEEERGRPSKSGGGSGLGKILNGNRKVRKPVISFFSDKARVLGEEIEKLNKYIETRKSIHRNVEKNVKEDVETLKRFLKEISLYSPGTKHSIDIRRADLERSLLSLRRELRVSEISLFKDILFLRNTQREMVFEYQALKRMAELVENGGNNGVAE